MRSFGVKNVDFGGINALMSRALDLGHAHRAHEDRRLGLSRGEGLQDRRHLGLVAQHVGHVDQGGSSRTESRSRTPSNWLGGAQQGGRPVGLDIGEDAELHQRGGQLGGGRPRRLGVEPGRQDLEQSRPRRQPVEQAVDGAR